MAGKENHDLFSQFSSNEGSLPLDFEKNAKGSEPPAEESEKKAEISESKPVKSFPRPEKSEPQRRPTHHVPPPYKKTAQEVSPAEPKKDIEQKNDIVIQEKPAEKAEFNPVSDKNEVKQAAVMTEETGKPVSSAMPPPVQTAIPLSAPALAPAPAASVNAASVPLVKETPTIPAPNIEKEPEAPPSPKQARHPKTQHAENTVTAKTEKQADPVVQVKTDIKPEIPEIKQEEVKSPHIPKNSVSELAKKETAVPHDRKTVSGQKGTKPETQKPVKKAPSPEKFSTDNATVGQLLQEGRVRSGLSIEQVSTSIKIKKSFIEALERDDFENLPASVYVNAYTRALCSLYNIDSKLVFGLLNKVKGKSLAHTVPEEVIHQLEKGKQVNIDQENKVKKMLLSGFAACFTVIAITLITYYFMHTGGKTTSSATVAKPVIGTGAAVPPSINTGASAKTLDEEMEKKLMAPHIFTMTSLPLAER